MTNLTTEKLARDLDVLAAFEPDGSPFISLYLNAEQEGRDTFQMFVRKELTERSRFFAEGSRERECFERDAGRIVRFLTDNREPSANGAAIFACASRNGFFKAIRFNAPFHKNRLHVSDRAHIYPLARLIERNPVFVVLLADSETARIFVFDLGRITRLEEFPADDKDYAAVGEHSQMRYRRRVENNRELHVNETIEMLECITAEEKAERIILAGDEIFIALLRQRLSDQIADKVIDILRLDIRAPEQEVLKATLESLREDTIQSDAEKVRDLFDQFGGGGGLAVAGLEKTMYALVGGQADELLLSALPDDILIDRKEQEETASVMNLAPSPGAAVAAALSPVRELSRKMIVDRIVSLARNTGAGITFVEDRNLLADVDGIGAFLRYRA